jgi:hypothetical protein
VGGLERRVAFLVKRFCRKKAQNAQEFLQPLRRFTAGRIYS